MFQRFIPLLLLLPSIVLSAPDFSMMGFATVDGGTTGGAGGAVVTPTTLAELKRYAEDKTTPYVIRITKEFNTGVAVKIDGTGAINSSGSISTTYGDIIRLGSNKTLVGIGSAGFFNRIGIIIQSQSNIIIRNIRFTMKDVPISRTDENKIVGWVDGAAKTLSDPDCIGIQADDETLPEAQRIVRHVWIDHCEFFNEDPSKMTDVDRYDGLVDGKNNSSNITISWCYFHDHHKASLFGKGDSDNFDRHITYSHNHFKSILSRLPLIRYGKVHMLNNLMVTSENGTNARINSDVYIEANHYEASKKPVFGKVSENGAATLVNNKWVDCDRVPQVVLSAAPGADPLSASEEILPGKFKPSTFYSYKADPVADVPAIVAANAGVGKISTTEYDKPVGVTSRGASAARLHAEWMGSRLSIDAPAGELVRITDVQGNRLHPDFAGGSSTSLDIHHAGIVLVTSGRETVRLAAPR
jgi:pectate lyase